MRVLIVNSDLPRNRGDRAILAGLIEVVRTRWPGADVTALSQFDARDSRWFGTGFLPQSPYSTNPDPVSSPAPGSPTIGCRPVGGGELLKDYTNRLGLLYWALKATGLRLVNRQLFGAYQGIGPTGARSSRRMIVYSGTPPRLSRAGRRMAEKLRAWGVRVAVTPSFDPAVLAPIEPWSDGLAERVQTALGAQADFLDDVVGISVRRWFHYRRGGWLPFSFRRSSEDTHDFRLYRQHVVELVDRITKDSDSNVMFIPMHMASTEGDDTFARDIVLRMRRPERARVLDNDSLSPAELTAVIWRCRYFVASRLHSAILATSAGVPAMALYYVPKGRLFFEQLDLPELALPIEVMLKKSAVDEVWPLVTRLREDRDALVATIAERIDYMAKQVLADAEAAWLRTPE